MQIFFPVEMLRLLLSAWQFLEMFGAQAPAYLCLFLGF